MGCAYKPLSLHWKPYTIKMPGIYIHIPFCKTRCDYCAFYSTTYGDSVRNGYVAGLCREMGERSRFFGSCSVSSVYLGGGTPSQLSLHCLRDIFGAVNGNFRILPEAEITMEVNPDDISGEYAAGLSVLPVNRISMGIQSFNDGLLRAIHRRHSAEKAVRSYELLRQSGFENISIDLIYALPGQTLREWESDLDKAVSLHPEHVSAYALSYEEGTPLHVRLQKGEVEEANEDLYTGMFALLIKKLEAAGYEHYEISNFALSGRRARHNSSYWSGERYLGIGAGAHSFDGKCRRMNLPDVMEYIASDGVPNEVEELTPADKYDEYVMTRLRTREGICLEQAEGLFGAAVLGYLMRSAKVYVDCGKLEIVRQAEGSFLRLTRNGIFVSDGIISDLMNPD